MYISHVPKTEPWRYLESRETAGYSCFPEKMKVNELIENLKSADADFRFMGLADIISTASHTPSQTGTSAPGSRPSSVGTHAAGMSQHDAQTLLPVVLDLVLMDKNGEVQTMAVKTLAHLLSTNNTTSSGLSSPQTVDVGVKSDMVKVSAEKLAGALLKMDEVALKRENDSLRDIATLGIS